MSTPVDHLRATFDEQFTAASTEADLRALRDQYLGRKGGAVAALMKDVASAPPAERPALGRLANELKQFIEQALSTRLEALASSRPPVGAVDVTLPGRPLPFGRRHPLTWLRERLEAIFARQGYEILDGAETEDDWHNFEALNMPPDHPARDMQDTFYLRAPLARGVWTAGGIRLEDDPRAATLLRTHTSAMQIRYMEQHRPPVRVIAPGRVYRRDNLDLTHTPMFQQVEGLVVGEGVTMSDLKGTIVGCLREMFGPDTKVMFRPSFFPYTEPSADVFMSCHACGGSGCAVCKRTGWIEVLGCGMVHPAVFEAVGYNPAAVTGFAFGIGIERLAMIMLGVDDIRQFYENDLRFLEQFPGVKILVSWLRDLVDVPVAPSALASDLHMAGFEVASVEPAPGSSSIDADAVIDLEITANRPDCLSVIGIAREAATLYDRPLSMPPLAAPGAAHPSAANGLRVVVEEVARCPRYCGAVADVTIGASPAWMQQRLAAAGVRPINNLVDVTNYVLLELGQPMHAFDFERIGGRELRVRLPRTGERVTTLDGHDRTLAPDMLVIGDAGTALALAGVMGGATSEVSAATRVIALESAWFDPAGIRRTSKRLGLSTEASYRFERGADIEAPPVALARACALIAEIGAGQARPGWIDCYPAPRPRRRVSLPASRAAQVLGVDIEKAETVRILSGLGFDVAPVSAGFDVTVPSWRVDVSRDVDLVEELARHHGYDRLPTTFPELAHVPARPNRRLERDRLVRRLAAGAGFAESVTFSFIARDVAEPFSEPGEIVEILNPLSEQFAVLRPSLLPGLTDAVAYNRRRGQDDVRLFELGTVFGTSTGERRTLGLAWLGAGTPEHWSQPRRPVDFFDIKGVVDAIGGGLGIAFQYAPVTRPSLVAGRSATIATREGDAASPIGTLGLLAHALVASRDLPAGTEIYVAELDLDSLMSDARFDATVASLPPPRHPAVVRDVSIVVDDTLPAAQVRGTIRESAPPTLVRIQEFDRYQGKGVPEQRVSLSYRFTFQAPDRTLTDTEVQRAMDEIIQALVRSHGAVQR